MITQGDCLEVLRTMADNSVESMVTDPPAGISFMGKDWDKDKGGRDEWIAWLESVMRECHRVLKPGAHAFVWAIPRTSHWTATAIENAGFEIRDVVTHITGQGFPKSFSVEKSMDKSGLLCKCGNDEENQSLQKPQRALDETLCERLRCSECGKVKREEVKGYGTALKPSAEFWWLARKPLSEKTVAKNVLAHGTGGINVDGCRIEYASERDLQAAIIGSRAFAKSDDKKGGGAGGYGTSKSVHGDPLKPESYRDHADALEVTKSRANKFRKAKAENELANLKIQGRFPSNVVLSHLPECEEVGVKKIKGGSGWSKTGSKESENAAMSGKNYAREPKPDLFAEPDGTETVPDWKCAPGCAVAELGDYSRFFYTAKASKSERNAGLGDKTNGHPTVKSLKLMRYLCRMITPPGGTVLDPFAGSGSTGVAALQEGFKFVGIEMETEYTEIARARIAHCDKEVNQLSF